MSRSVSPAGQLARLGLLEPSRAVDQIESWPVTGDELAALLDRLVHAADPDQAVQTLTRLFEVAPAVADRVAADPELADRLVAVTGASRALGASLVAHPVLVDRLAEGPVRRPRDELRTELVGALGTGAAAVRADRLRLAYRAHLLDIAVRDLAADDPVAGLPDIAAELSDLADACVEAALVIARDEVGGRAAECRLAVVALGKCGAQELNYISDVDVLWVAEPVPGSSLDVDGAVRIGTRLASAVTRICSAHTRAGSIWELDAALRPEGKAGPLVRSLASMRSYYTTWAKTWEFQAMLKARPMAGDLELADDFCSLVGELVWQAAERPHFVEDVRAMRRRVLDHIPSEHADRELKLGAGGLRDVEFSVQLLQLVHGRVDERLRIRGTLPALEALVEHGYVGRDDGAALAEAYRFTRALEHRVQLTDLRRTHLLPTEESRLRSLGRSLAIPGGAPEVEQRWRRSAREVQRLHQRMFYSPVLAAVSRIGTDALRLTTAAAADRLKALGFHDAKAALGHVEALSSGMSRQAEIQRQLLPAMLGWLADGPNPDHGLLAFRQLSETLGRTPWYLRALRDEGAMAERLAKLLASSRYVVTLLQRAPEAVQLLAVDEPPAMRTLADWRSEMRSAAGRQDDPARAIEAIRGVRQRGLLRVAAADVLGAVTTDVVGRALTDLTSATIDTALEVVLRDYDGPPLAVIAMGRWGGQEMSYASDADAMFVLGDGGSERAIAEATQVIGRLRDGLGAGGPVPALAIDLGLRPEGKGGPMVKTLSAYRNYYQRWSSTWELQALVRASALAGDPELGAELITEIDQRRWPEGGLRREQVAEIRRLKARMESERLPRGVDRHAHLKLGPGGLSDVEWTVQLVQLNHAAAEPTLRTPTTMGALTAATGLGLVSDADAAILAAAWRMASRIRDLSMLVRGRPSDALPSDTRDLAAVAELMGYPDPGASHLEADHRRVSRQAVHVVDRLFWGK